MKTKEKMKKSLLLGWQWSIVSLIDDIIPGILVLIYLKYNMLEMVYGLGMLIAIIMANALMWGIISGVIYNNKIKKALLQEFKDFAKQKIQLDYVFSLPQWEEWKRMITEFESTISDKEQRYEVERNIIKSALLSTLNPKRRAKEKVVMNWYSLLKDIDNKNLPQGEKKLLQSIKGIFLEYPEGKRKYEAFDKEMLGKSFLV